MLGVSGILFPKLSAYREQDSRYTGNEGRDPTARSPSSYRRLIINYQLPERWPGIDETVVRDESFKENVVKDKSYAFALKIVELYRFLAEQKREFVLSRQLLRSGTAIGALVREAEQGESIPDFIHKMAIALKEASESDYWIDLVFESGYPDEKTRCSIHRDCLELVRLLTSIVKTSKERN